MISSLFSLAAALLSRSVLATPLLDTPALRAEAQNEERVPLATVYSSCKNNKQVALTFDDGPYVYA